MSKAQTEINITLKEFRMDQIADGKMLVFIGKRNTGKSVLVLDYLYYNQDIPFCTCISPTDDYNLTFRPHIPSRFIFDTYTPELIESFVKRQKTITRKKTAAIKGLGDPKYKGVDPRGILIMDDCLADAGDWKNDKNIKWIFMNGRHANITMILTMQYQLGITPNLRANFDYCFLCKETKKLEKEKLWKHYAGMFEDYHMFNVVFNRLTKDYGCMVIDNTSQSDLLDDQVYYYKATVRDPGSFRVCYDEFWENNEDFINKDEDLEPEQAAPTAANSGYGNDDYNRYVTTKSKFKFNVGIKPQSRW